MKENLRRKIEFVIVTTMFIATMFLVNYTNSRYMSEVNIQYDLNVAIPQIVLDTSQNNLTNPILPGDTTSYEFYINNYNDINQNEVLMTYYINLELSTQDIPLTYKIYQIAGTTETELTQDTEGYGPITLDYEQQQSQHFKIIFTWDENDNSVSYANKQFSFKIKINATQVV